MKFFNFLRKGLWSFSKRNVIVLAVMFLMFITPVTALAFTGDNSSSGMPEFFGIRIEFLIFAATLICVAVFHKKTFYVAIAGLLVLLCYKFIYDSGFSFIEHITGNIETNPFLRQLTEKETRVGEWGIILNLTGLLLGFAILAKIFEDSGIPDKLPDLLPDNIMGPFLLLVLIFLLSAILDNIAAALIGGSIAYVVFDKKIHLGYLAAIVGVSNAGGAGSVLGDTTTTMMWIDGVSFISVTPAFIAAGVALIIIAWFASNQQHKLRPINKVARAENRIKYENIILVVLILTGAIVTNILFDMPWLGVWLAIFTGVFFTKIPWGEISGSLKGTVFLISLVLCASFMPVETLPEAHWSTAFILGLVSSVFDNIPLTKLCLDQGHYDWGLLAYAVGFGGSMMWFGSSAGVAITNRFPEGRNMLKWLINGWHIIVAYIAGFFVLLSVWGWHPASNNKHKEPANECVYPECKIAIKEKLQSDIGYNLYQQNFYNEDKELSELINKCKQQPGIGN